MKKVMSQVGTTPYANHFGHAPRGYCRGDRNFATQSGYCQTGKCHRPGLLEFSVREVLNKTATRVMGVLNPLKLTITNYPEGKTEWMETVNNPEDPEAGTGSSFFWHLWIEKEDFMEDPPKKFSA
ncbi:MAG: hypothetical protein R2825_22285 [Saprospiraceae bacterium]